MTLSMESLDKSALRNSLRRRRRALTPGQQQRAALKLDRQLRRQPEFLRARRIAFYLAADGEISPQVLLRRASDMGKECFLPVIVHRHLQFQRYRPGTALRSNRFGIPEPAGRRPQRCPPWLLDLVLMPLVGFDRRRQRLGMGGGYYDRSFAFARRLRGRRPALIGLAHDCQQVDALPNERWDVALDGIATDRRFMRLRRCRQGGL